MIFIMPVCDDPPNIPLNSHLNNKHMKKSKPNRIIGVFLILMAIAYLYNNWTSAKQGFLEGLFGQ